MREKAMKILNELMERYEKLRSCEQEIIKSFDIIKSCYDKGGKVLVCGNGGSAADSEHIVGELVKAFKLKRPIKDGDIEKIKAAKFENWEHLSSKLQGSLPAICLSSHSALFTAYVNDVEPDMVFAQQVYCYGKSGDVLIGISTSGNSQNVVNAIKIAKAFGLYTVGLAGQSGGKLAALCDVSIKVPETETFKVQELHMPVYHSLCAMLEEEFFG